jgi:hypothetical protein
MEDGCENPQIRWISATVAGRKFHRHGIREAVEAFVTKLKIRWQKL